MTERYTRPGLFWAITKVQHGPPRYVTMRVTRITESRIYGGVEEVGTYRKPSDVWGRYESRDAAGRDAAKLNFVIIQYTQAFARLHDAYAALAAQAKELNEARQAELNTILTAFPRMAIMSDRFGKA